MKHHTSKRPNRHKGEPIACRRNINVDIYVQPEYIPIPSQYKNVLKRLREYPYKRNGLIPYAIVYSLFGSCLRFTKNSTVAVLTELERQGVIEIVPYNGIRILKGGRLRGSACSEGREVEE